MNSIYTELNYLSYGSVDIENSFMKNVTYWPKPNFEIILFNDL